MNDAALAAPREPSLVRLLSDYFSSEELATLLGPGVAQLGPEIWDPSLRTPVSDLVQRPGKEFRAGLMRICYLLAGGQGQCPERLSRIVEVLHAGSLVIDDIQDESTTRRGAPALHRKYGLPIALNAGNWMYFLALSLVGQLGLGSEAQLSVHKTINATLLRCHHGQGLDLTSLIGDLSRPQIYGVVQATSELKTGALMALAAELGGVAADASEEVLCTLGTFGRDVGVILQMLDDLGGLLSEKRCHKGHEDLLLGRATWPWAWLCRDLDALRFEELRDQSARVVRRDLHPELLARALRSELRGSGRVRVRRHIHQAFARLSAVVGSVPGLEDLRSEIRRMEESYV